MEAGENQSWMWVIIDPIKMFPDLPPAIAIISYACVVVSVFIFLLICIWLCSVFSSKGLNSRKTLGSYRSVKEARTRQTPWTVTEKDTEHGAKTNDAFQMGEKNAGQYNRGTLNRLDMMPWWDYVSSNPSVNWYNYYRLAEGRNRARTCERKRYPWQMEEKTREPPLKYHTRAQSDNGRRLLPQSAEVDALWENVHPRSVDPRYWRRPSVNDSFFPRFRMIPRATWIDGRMLACLGHHNYSDDYANHSMTSLTSTDMQIMQMVAKRHQYLRPSRGDVFYGHHVTSRGMGGAIGNYSGVSPLYPTPYDTHNNDVSRRQEMCDAGRMANDIDAKRPQTSTPAPKIARRTEAEISQRRAPPTPPPSPPGYPPPPTPPGSPVLDSSF